jgi:Fe-S-cluster-containing dehydrogenase component
MNATTADITIEGQSLIDDYLAERDQLTAAEKFSQWHDADAEPAQAKYYRDLMPLTHPGEGEQYAFEVDMDACSGCKACVTACHNLNGLDESESWRDVGQLIGGALGEMMAEADGVAPSTEPATEHGPAVQHVTAACHHCVEPACLDGCPVKAYEKDPVTGIVKHLDDQCIGCQYCILKCPYDVPKYNANKGIVRKCDMCSDRLTEGEAPACAQACPTNAIAIRIVDQQQERQRAESNEFLSGAPQPDYTVPTTHYKTDRDLSHMRPGDYYSVAPEHAHTPLVWMLVLTQLAVGGFLVGWILEWITPTALASAIRPIQTMLAVGTGLLALGASTLHLGRPMYAFRAVIGLGSSWLSREIVAFGVFAKAAVAYAAVLWLMPDVLGGWPRIILPGAVLLLGAFGIFCSIMIYHDTRREFWHVTRSGPRFGLTMLVLGIAVTLLGGLITTGVNPHIATPQFMHGGGRTLAAALAGLLGFKLGLEAIPFRHLWHQQLTPMRRTAVLMTQQLHQVTLGRFAAGLGAIAISTLLAVIPTPDEAATFVFIAVSLVFLLALVGEWLERYLFFTAVVRPKMPGGLAV